ncbi:MAG: flagellar biosynthesis protein FlgM [Proteobacteria bacterium]|nr:MAG: flagellar biosynthesis protein FlgM [Pseudomonadota bacterium]
MQWRGRRESSNVEDRRGMKTAGAIGGGTIIIAIIYALLGGDPNVILNSGGQQQQVTSDEQYPAQKDEASQFVRVVLADTEDVWSKVFAEQGRSYTNPKLVLFSDRVQSACGVAGSSVGPFYCPADQKVYLDLGFFSEMATSLGASGDFAQAYVIAHEVGHHVQNQFGISEALQAKRSSLSETEFNKESVQVELQADCLAGIWAKDTNDMKKILDEGDVEEAMNAASSVGDDKLQKASRGYVVPDSFTHGSSAQRMAAFNQGFTSGSISACNLGGGQARNATR